MSCTLVLIALKHYLSLCGYLATVHFVLIGLMHLSIAKAVVVMINGIKELSSVHGDMKVSWQITG
jgi:hypothetical protein